MTRQVRILLLSATQEECDRWAAMLPESGYQYVFPSDFDERHPVDIVLADRPVADSLPLAGRGSWDRGETGVITIGCQQPADVALPADVTPREMQLACRMLDQIVRLRRQRGRDQRARRLLTELARSDPLTGLLNRRGWDDERARLAKSDQPQPTACLALFDLDQLKQVNDQNGMPVGDAVLKSFAQGLVRSAAEGDLIARLGGDEFAALLVGRNEPAQVVEDMRQAAVQNVPLQELPRVTATAGYALGPLGGDQADALYSAADEALRAAKRAGRNRTEGG